MGKDRIAMNLIEPEDCRDFDKRIVKPSRWRFVTATRRWLFNRIAEPSRVVQYRTVSLDTSEVMTLVSKAANSAALIGARGGKVYMGPDQFFKCANEMQKFYSPISVQFNATAGYGRKITVLDMEVVMLPWMDGVLVVPDEIRN